MEAYSALNQTVSVGKPLGEQVTSRKARGSEVGSNSEQILCPLPVLLTNIQTHALLYLKRAFYLGWTLELTKSHF